MAEYLGKTGLAYLWGKIKSNFASSAHTHTGADLRPVAATSSDGVSYTATVPGLTELYAGLTLTIIPDKASTVITPTLNVNGLGAKNIIMPIGGASTSVTTNAAKLTAWLSAGAPVVVKYDGTRWKSEIQAASAQYLYGNVPVTSGGTGAANAADARTNLEITPKNIGAAQRVVWSGIAVNTSAWAASGSYYAATVSVSGMLSTDNPHSVDIERSDDLDADAICEEAFALVKRITTADGSITLYAMEIPASNFTIWMEGTR